MGYYTYFTLRTTDVHGAPVPLPAIDLLGITPGAMTLRATIQWYDHESDMETLSMQYPHTVFILDGEEQGDVWRMFFLAGKSHTWRQPPCAPPEFSSSILEKLGGPVV